MKPWVVTRAYGLPVHEASNRAHPALERELRDRGSRQGNLGRSRVKPDYITAIPQRGWRLRQPAQNIAARHPHVYHSRQILKLLFHVPAHVGAENELHR